jgi:hypothetical protein
MHSAFCSRDQLAEARNAITCALASFVLTSIAICHAARDTTRRWRNLRTIPFADDVSCSRDHSQNFLATVRVVVLHTHGFCFPIALSARATTRRGRLLETLAHRSSQTGGVCGIMTTIIHNVSRVTSARSSEELAESYVNKTTLLETEHSESP